MLGVRALLLAVSALANGRELARHLLDGPSQLCKLAGNRRYVLSGCHTKVDTILCGSDGTSGSRRSTATAGRRPPESTSFALPRSGCAGLLAGFIVPIKQQPRTASALMPPGSDDDSAHRY